MKTKKLILAAFAVSLLSSSPSFAEKGAEKNGATDNGRNTKGAIASELKWRNAAHASAQAFLNANPDSAVGKLATYKTATQAVLDAYAAAGIEPDSELRLAVDIQSDIDATAAAISDMEGGEGFDPESSAYTDLVNLLAQFEAELALPDELPIIQEAEQEAADAVGVGDLSDEAMTALWELLEM